MKRTPVTVIVLTLNEELNLPFCLTSVIGWATDVLVLDSGSTDQTVAVATAHGATVFHRPFDSYAAQRTYAVTQLPIATDWVLFLDADEALPEKTKINITDRVTNHDNINGYMIRLHFYFLDRRIKYGGYADTQKLVLFKRSCLLGIERLMNEHVIVMQPLSTLASHIIHHDRRPVWFWYEKHVRYSVLQAQEMKLTKEHNQLTISWKQTNNRRDRRRWIKEQVWSRIPLWSRPVLYFTHRYFLCRGFLDGKEGFIYHFSHAFLYQFMIATIYEDQSNYSRHESR